jgi:hypothetical protein
MKQLKNLWFLVVLAVLAAGCSWSSDSKHVPPEGLGSIVLRNNTAGSFSVTIDGVVNAAGTAASATIPYDLRPGTYVVTLQQSGGPRTWSGSVTVQLGRLTDMDVTTDPANPNLYDVVTFLE